jgi:hypothetical protein
VSRSPRRTTFGLVERNVRPSRGSDVARWRGVAGTSRSRARATPHAGMPRPRATGGSAGEAVCGSPCAVIDAESEGEVVGWSAGGSRACGWAGAGGIAGRRRGTIASGWCGPAGSGWVASVGGTVAFTGAAVGVVAAGWGELLVAAGQGGPGAAAAAEAVGGVGVEGLVPAAAVDEGVVTAAQQHQVREGVVAAVRPGDHVVDVAPGGGGGAGGEPAALVAGDHGPAGRRGDLWGVPLGGEQIGPVA